MIEAVEVVVSGRVQGVGFREFARRAADRLGVGGFVRNRSDGTVEARIVGERDLVEAMLAELSRGPPYGRVDRVTIAARGDAVPESGFRIDATR